MIELLVYCIVQGNEMHLEEDTGAGYVAHRCHWETALQERRLCIFMGLCQDDELKEESGGVEDGYDIDL
jgi:hypothetical protein